MKFLKSIYQERKKGFTFIEVLVVTAIIGVLMTVIYSNHSTFSKKFAAEDNAYKFATALRRAQVYTVGVREYVCNGVQMGNFNKSFGVNIDSIDFSKIIFFVDQNNDGEYNENPASCDTEVINLNLPGISYICSFTTAGAKRCYPGDPFPRKIDLVFNRPSTKPIVRLYNSGGASLSGFGTNPSNNPKESYREIVVYFGIKDSSQMVGVKMFSTGQVSIRNCGDTNCFP